MFIRNSKDYKAYFQKYKGFEGIQTVGYGSYDRFLAMLKDPSFSYPCLWVERPTVSKIEIGGSKKRFSGGIVVLMNTSNGTTWDAEDDILANCEDTIFKILEQMAEDANEDSFEFDDSPTDTESKDRESGDMAIGTRAEITLIGGYDCQ